LSSLAVRLILSSRWLGWSGPWRVDHEVLNRTPENHHQNDGGDRDGYGQNFVTHSSKTPMAAMCYQIDGAAVVQTGQLLRSMNTRRKSLVVCVSNAGYAVSLEKRKIYVSLRDAAADKHGLLRIVDESGDDYLYPKALFRAVDLPVAVRRAVMAA
jgi:hypothetical protein